MHARHLIRLRQRDETVQLRDAVPEIVFLNSHDGTSAYQLRVGLLRVVCTNGLIVSAGVFPVWRVMHRGDVVADVVTAALQISERFDALAGGRSAKVPRDLADRLLSAKARARSFHALPASRQAASGNAPAERSLHTGAHPPITEPELTSRRPKPRLRTLARARR